MANTNDMKLTQTEQNILDFSKSKLGKTFELMITQIPGANVVYSGIVGNIERKNLIQMLQGWVERELDRLFNEKSIEHIRLVKHSILASLRCSHEAKIERILDILSDSLKKNVSSEIPAEDLINVVVELTENEAIIFREIYDKFGTENEKKDYIDRSKVFQNGVDSTFHINIKVDDIIKLVPEYSSTMAYYLNRLVGKGLLQEDTYSIPRGADKLYQHTAIGWQLFETFHIKD